VSSNCILQDFTALLFGHVHPTSSVADLGSGRDEQPLPDHPRSIFAQQCTRSRPGRFDQSPPRAAPARTNFEGVWLRARADLGWAAPLSVSGGGGVPPNTASFVSQPQWSCAPRPRASAPDVVS